MATKAAKSPAKAKTKKPVDRITLSVVRGILETTQREMTLSLEKTARSSVFNLAHDYSTALFNAKPEMILQGQDIPIHLGSLIPAMKIVAGFFGDDIHEGDLSAAQRSRLGRQPRDRHVHVQAGVLQGRTGLLDGLQGPSDRYRRPGAGGIQSRRQGNLCRMPAHSAAQDLGSRQAAPRRAQHDPDQYAGPPRPGRRFPCADRRLPGGRAQPDRHARQIRQGNGRCLYRGTARHGRTADAQSHRHGARRHL